MPTREIRTLDELGLVQIRIVEDDGSCDSEPCYPADMFSSPQMVEEFADGLLARIIAQRNSAHCH